MRIVTTELVSDYVKWLQENEMSRATIEKYRRDVMKFVDFAKNQHVDKQLSLRFKEYLCEKYSIVSANSIIAAINSFFKFVDWNECCVKQFRVQKKVFCEEESELTKREYDKLVDAAKRKSSDRLSHVIQTICGTGIRVSELKFITVEAVVKGEATVNCKGKARVVFIVSKLRKMLLAYAKRNHITSGSIFITKTGKALDRSNIWRDMKALCKIAGVNSKKVFPHNLRHLFARAFYELEKDIVKLADMLGHSSINTTRIYIVSTGSEHRRRMERMKLII